MPKEQSVTINGVSIDIAWGKKQSEKDFVEHEKHTFESEAKAKETWKLFNDFLKKKDS